MVVVLVLVADGEGKMSKEGWNARTRGLFGTELYYESVLNT